jgi:hypothetical protein
LAWRLFQENPHAVSVEATRIRQGLIGPEERATQFEVKAIKDFLSEAHDLLEEIVRTVQQLPASNLDEAVLGAYVKSWEELKQRPFLMTMNEQLDTPMAARHLADAGLAGAQLSFKLAGWRRALADWFDARTAGALRRALRWANVVLGSLGEALTGPGLEVFKEFKEGTELILDEALPPGGFLHVPAPAYS